MQFPLCQQTVRTIASYVRLSREQRKATAEKRLDKLPPRAPCTCQSEPRKIGTQSNHAAAEIAAANHGRLMTRRRARASVSESIIDPRRSLSNTGRREKTQFNHNQIPIG